MKTLFDHPAQSPEEIAARLEFEQAEREFWHTDATRSLSQYVVTAGMAYDYESDREGCRIAAAYREWVCGGNPSELF